MTSLYDFLTEQIKETEKRITSKKLQTDDTAIIYGQGYLDALKYVQKHIKKPEKIEVVN